MSRIRILNNRSAPRVCIFLRYHYPRYSGAGQAVTRLAQYFQDHGVSAVMMTGWPGWYWGADKATIGHKVIRLLYVPDLIESRVGTLLFSFFAFLRILFLPVSIRLIIAVGEARYIGWAALASQLSGRKFIQRTSMANGGYPRAKRFPPNFQFWVQRADAAVALSETIRRHLIASGFRPGRIRVIPNGNNSERLRPASPRERDEARAALGIAQEAKIVVFVGMVSLRKGIPVLLEAWRMVVQDVPHAHLLLAGPCGHDAGFPFGIPEAEELVIGYGITGSVHFLGSVKDVTQVYRAADVFVLPSQQEGHPNALVEAMISGLPCVVTRFQGFDQSMGLDGEHLLIADQCSESIAERLIHVLQDTDEIAAIGASAREYAQAKFSMDAVGAEYLRLVGEVLDERILRFLPPPLS